MPNDSSLPRPNIPQPPSGGSVGTGNSAAGAGDTSITSPPSQPLSNPLGGAGSEPGSGGSGPGYSSGGPGSTNSVPANPASPVAPSGLDTQHPGGAPPQLNEQGQVVRTSTISQTREAPVFEQPKVAPQSTLQKVQAASANQAAAATGPNTSLSESPINPNAQQNDPNQNQPQAQVGSQQAISAQQKAQQAQGGEDGTNPNIKASAGVDLPGLAGRGSPATDQEQQDDSKKGGRKSRLKKQKTKKAPKAPSAPKMASAKGKIPKVVPFILGAVVIVGAVIFGITKVLDSGSGGSTTSPTTPQGESPGQQAAPVEQPVATGTVLSYWGLWEPSSVLEEVLSDFEQQTGISVDYRQQSHKDYRTRLQAAIEAGSGPDVFRYHATWVPMLAADLAPMPNSVMSLAEYQDAFYPIYSQQLQHNGQLVGIPLMYDGLGLYYNKGILQTANEEVPSTWGEVRVLAEKLTVRAGDTIERGGIALGNTTNVEHFADILGLLIYQNGGDPTNAISGEVRDAIDFYALFAKNTPVYGTNLPSSTVAFAREEVAMMLAPSWRAHEVLHLNPELNFDIAPVPKLGESEFGWATYWAEGVSSESNNKNEAWQLLKYLSSPEVLRKMYSAQSEIRAFGEIYPRPEMASELEGAAYVSAYLQDAPLAKSAPMCSYTHDVGLNDNIIDYYADAINAAVGVGLRQDDLQTLNQGVNQVLNQYGL